MSMNLDKPLDDIIKSNPKKQHRNARGAKAGGRPTNTRKVSGGAKAAAIGGKAANAAAVVAANRNKPLVIPGRAPGGNNQGSKIIVSNLPLDVTEAQVKELFSTTIGPLRKIAMSYRANGQSTGQVTVEFQKYDDATRAYQQYNNRLIDGKKTLRVEVVVDPARAALIQAPIAAAVHATVPTGAAAAAGRGGRGGRGAKGAARGGRGSGTSRQARPQRSAADLDAEMEDYAANKAD